MRHAARDIVGRLALAMQSVTFLFASSPPAAWLGETVTRKYSEPIEIDEHRRQALAGPAPGQARFVEAYLKPGDSVVDIGCAAGRSCFAVHARGHRVVTASSASTWRRRWSARRARWPARNGCRSRSA